MCVWGGGWGGGGGRGEEGGRRRGGEGLLEKGKLKGANMTLTVTNLDLF